MSGVKPKRSLPYRVIRANLIGLALGIGMLNFPNATNSLAAHFNHRADTCMAFADYAAKPQNQALITHMKQYVDSRAMYDYAVESGKVVCHRDHLVGANAIYDPASGRTVLRDFDARHGISQPLSTLTHEILHAYQEANGALSHDVLARRYDTYSNLLIAQYKEAASYAYETAVMYDYFQDNPNHRHMLMFTFSDDMLRVFEQSLEILREAGTPDIDARNEAMADVFDYVLQHIPLFTEFYAEPYLNPPLGVTLSRLFAYKTATKDQVTSFTALPNGYNLYRYDSLPKPEDAMDGRYLPPAVAAP